MNPKAIHQFHSGSAYGDAVTNGLLFTQQLLQELGFKSEIYVEHICPELAHQLRHYSRYKPSANQILLVHHSMGHDLTDWIVSLPDRKILVYHNITPAHYFYPGTDLHKYSIIGREQLNIFCNNIAATICDSAYNSEEVVTLGYQNVSVIPLLIDVQKIQNAQYNQTIVEENKNIFTLLFVGRICENKCQADLIQLFRYIVLINTNSQLILIGNYSPNEQYYQYLQQLIQEYELTKSVKVVGKVSDEELYSWYRVADMFVCMSEHEGFGVPLIEAMLFDTPVLAYKSTNIPYTLGEGGILFNEKNFEQLAELINLIYKDRNLRRTILQSQRNRIEDFLPAKIKIDLASVINQVIGRSQQIEKVEDDSKNIHFQIEGPFETNYSLAIVNRELAFALERQNPGQVALFATEGLGDYQPDIKAIKEIKGLDLLWKRGKKKSAVEVLIRNLYPPRVSDMDGLINLLYFAWEESNIPEDWVESFNFNLDGLTVLSKFVKKALIDSGTYTPIAVAGCGIEQVLREKRINYPKYLGKSFKFLHISSCFPRKGVDILLQAYTQSFSATDDVTLVIKTFPNIHNNVSEQIKNIQANSSNPPEIVLIDEDLPTGYIVDLYHRCHALVAPSRGEGFGLPMAEAMLFNLPVITTGFGGQTDFCSEQTAWLVDFEFQRANTHLSTFDSVWVEPSIDHLSQVMQEVYALPKEKLHAKLQIAKSVVETNFTWNSCASRVVNTVKKLQTEELFKNVKTNVGLITSWNSKCGIYVYSKHLYDNCLAKLFNTKILASRKDILVKVDENNVIRCWDDLNNPDLSVVETVIKTEKLDAVIIQFNFGFYEINALGKLLVYLVESGVKVIVIFHSTKDVNQPNLQISLRTINKELALADRLLVHTISDLNRLKSFGLVNNTALLPHGARFCPSVNRLYLKEKLEISNTKIIASYGFLLPNKGIEQLIEAFYIITKTEPNVVLFLVNSLYANPLSYQLKDKCKDLISKLGISDKVVAIDDFLEEEESLCLLECADMIVFPYQQSNESSSAAVRSGLSSNRPVVCTPLEVFEDVKDIVHFLPSTKPDDIAYGILELLDNPNILNSKHELQQKWLKEHSWEVVARRLGGIVQALTNEFRESIS